MNPGVTFTHVSEPPPDYLPLSGEERLMVATELGIPREDWENIVKRPVLTLPQTPLCELYMEWFHASTDGPPGVGIVIMSANQFIQDYGSTALNSLLASLRQHGRPVAHYQFLVCVLPPMD